jgi:putative ABC transport system permease protein
MAQLVGTSVAQPRFNALLLVAVSAAAVLLAAIGLYGVLSYSVSTRTREIGIRVALGADRGAVSRLVMAEGLRLVFAGVLAGVLAAFALTRLVSSLLYSVSAADPPAFATALLVVATAAVLAGYLPVRRATKLDPVDSLRRD